MKNHERNDPDRGVKANALLVDGPAAGTLLRLDHGPLIDVPTVDGIVRYKAAGREPDGLVRYEVVRREESGRASGRSARVIGEPETGGTSGEKQDG